MGARRLPPAPVLAALACLALGACTYRVGERDLLHPKRLPELPESVARRSVLVRAADGTALRGWLLTPPKPRRALLWFYGNGETAFEAAPLLYQLAGRLDAEVLVVDYRGYGWSDGEASLRGLAADAPLLVDELARLAGSDMPLLVVGRSLGCVYALRAALERPVAGVVLFAPPTSLRDVLAAWERNAPWYVRPFVRLRPDDELRELGPQPVEAVAGLAAPLLVVHGTRDRTIPFALGKRIFEHAGSPLKRLCEVPGAGHNDVDLLGGRAAACLGEFVGEVAPAR